MVVSVTVYLLIPMPIETESINLLLTTKQVVFSGGVFFFSLHIQLFRVFPFWLINLFFFFSLEESLRVMLNHNQRHVQQMRFLWIPTIVN